MKVIYWILFICLPVCSFGQLLEPIGVDSFKTILYSDRGDKLHDTDKIKLLNFISLGFRENTDSSIRYAFMALEMAQKAGYTRGLALSLNSLGKSLYNNFDTVLSYHHQALRIFEKIHDTMGIATTLNHIGGIYYNMDKMPQALDFFERSLAFFNKCNDNYSIAATQNSLAATHLNLGNYSIALEYEFQALRYFEETANLRKAGTIISNIANCYAGLREYNKALPYSERAIRQLSLFPKDFRYRGVISERGYMHYLIATDNLYTIKPDSLIPATKNANLQLAIKYYFQAKELARNEPYYIKAEIYNRLSSAYETLGDNNEAFKYYKLYVAARDSAISEEGLLKVAKEETIREAYLKENQIKINEIQAANKRTERILFIVSFLLLGCVVVIILRNNKKQKNTNLALETANSKLAKEKVKLEDANERIAGEKEKSDQLAVELQESILQKDAYAGQLSIAADMKTRFLANISHELRTPVTLLTGMLELMKTNNDNNTVKTSERLSVAYNNSRKLQHMVEEILDLSRLETKVSTLNTEAKEIAPVIKRMVYAFETFIESEHLTLEFNEKDCRGIYVSIDENKLEKVMNNLVYNAIKFNKREGHIKVDLSVSGDKEHFVISINNSGAIISPEDLPHVFERFYQANTKAAKAEGVGIGLSLVKEFTLMMGGTVEAESKEGQGTTFTLQFPVAESTVATPVVSEEIEGTQEQWEHFPEFQTVLIVEDNTEMRYYLREVLQGKVNLAEAPNGKKALEWLTKNKADLIISDMMMPEMGGEELVTHLKNDPVYRKIPVITLTALADSGSRANMLSLGIDDYIVKPFNASELRVRVYNLLNNLEERRKFEMVPVEEDDISLESKEAELFKEKIRIFVLERMKTIDVSVYDLAYELGMSERQLYRLSKKLTGCSPAQLIKEVRLQKAYELLLGGTIYKIDDVARQIGFEDSSYFSRQFLERFGKRPSEFL